MHSLRLLSADWFRYPRRLVPATGQLRQFGPLFSAMVAGLTVTATEGFSVIVVDEDAVVSARLVAAVTVHSLCCSDGLPERWYRSMC